MDIETALNNLKNLFPASYKLSEKNLKERYTTFDIFDSFLELNHQGDSTILKKVNIAVTIWERSEKILVSFNSRKPSLQLAYEDVKQQIENYFYDHKRMASGVN